jgi:hypothetical protein
VVTASSLTSLGIGEQAFSQHRRHCTNEQDDVVGNTKVRLAEIKGRVALVSTRDPEEAMRSEIRWREGSNTGSEGVPLVSPGNPEILWKTRQRSVQELKNNPLYRQNDRRSTLNDSVL